MTVPTPALVAYTDTPASPATAVDQNDYGVGPAVLYTLVKKLGIRMGSTVQSEDTFWNRDIGSLLVNNFTNTVTLNSAPDVGAVVILPGSKYIDLRAYDVNSVLGDLSPRVKQYPFYIGPDSTLSITTFKYVKNPSQTGIIVQMTDVDPGFGAALTWLNIAASLADGTPAAYQAASLPLYLPDISGVTTTVNPQVINDTSITVVDGSQIHAGFILIIEPGTIREEQVRCTAVVGNVLTVTPLGFNHGGGSAIYEYLQKVWLRTNIPVNASGGTPVNLNDIATKLICSLESRI